MNLKLTLLGYQFGLGISRDISCEGCSSPTIPHATSSHEQSSFKRSQYSRFDFGIAAPENGYRTLTWYSSPASSYAFLNTLVHAFSIFRI